MTPEEAAVYANNFPSWHWEPEDRVRFLVLVASHQTRVQEAKADLERAEENHMRERREIDEAMERTEP